MNLLHFYEEFEIGDHVGTQLSDDNVFLVNLSQLQDVHVLVLKEIPKL